MGHRHKDSRLKWTTTDAEPEVTHPADSLTAVEVTALKVLLVAGGGGGTPVPPPNPPPAGDVTAPTVSGVVVSAITTTTAIVSWTTNEAATGVVEYGPTTVYGASTSATASGTSHSRSLTGMTPGQIHHFRIRATDTAGNLRLDQDRTVTTLAPTPPPSPSTMPTTNLPGWQLIFNDDFLTTVPEGQFPAAVAAKWGAYPSPWDDTSNHGIYSPEIASIHDSLLDIHIRTVGGVHKVCAPYPRINGATGPFGYSVGNDQLYGRYAIRFRADAINGYKTAWLLWPRSENWPTDGEIDFPEGDFVSTISAFMHRQNGVDGSDQDGYSTAAVYPTWHTAVIEWAPNRCEFFLDGVSIGASTSRVPNTPMHWVIQTETDLNGSPPPDAAQGHVLIDWVAVWAYALPDTTAPVPTNIVISDLATTSARISWSQAEAGTGQVRYGTSTGYGSTTTLETNFLTAHSQPISGLLPNVTYHFAVVTADAAGNVGLSSDRTFTTVALNPPPIPPASAIYGPGISGDGLGNTRFQGSARIQSCRFRATYSSALTAFTFYYLGPPDPGYALGTGGTWKAEIFADDASANHYPTGSALCTQNVAALGGSDADRVIAFASPATLVAGRLYHLVFTLTDASPDANHFSTDHWFIRQVPTGAPDGRINPRFHNTDWAHMYYEHPSGPWVTRSQYTPILDLAYANGQHQGQSYGEAQYGPNDVGEITGTSKMVRERFTVSGGNRQITGAGIRLLREYGTDPLTVRLEDNAGTLIDSFTIAANFIPIGPAPTGANNSDNDLGVNAKWQAGVFAAIRTLVNGTTYRLRLSTAAGSKYWAWTNRRLSESYPNYTAATAFQDGYAEVTTNGSTWSALGVDVNQYDLQFYLAVV